MSKPFSTPEPKFSAIKNYKTLLPPESEDAIDRLSEALIGRDGKPRDRISRETVYWTIITDDANWRAQLESSLAHAPLLAGGTSFRLEMQSLEQDLDLFHATHEIPFAIEERKAFDEGRIDKRVFEKRARLIEKRIMLHKDFDINKDVLRKKYSELVLSFVIDQYILAYGVPTGKKSMEHIPGSRFWQSSTISEHYHSLRFLEWSSLSDNVRTLLTASSASKGLSNSGHPGGSRYEASDHELVLLASKAMDETPGLTAHGAVNNLYDTHPERFAGVNTKPESKIARVVKRLQAYRRDLAKKQPRYF